MNIYPHFFLEVLSGSDSFLLSPHSTQTHLLFPPRVLPPSSDLQPHPSPRGWLTCRKREVLLVGSQWNSTVLSCEGSTWGSITPTDSGTSAGIGWQTGSKAQASQSIRAPKPDSSSKRSLVAPHSPMSRMRSPGRLHLHPSSCCCSVYCRRRSWNTTRTTLCGHRRAWLIGQRVPGHLGTSSHTWGTLTIPSYAHLASHSQFCPDAHLPLTSCETGEVT